MGDASSGRIAGKVAIVTGGAGGLGSAQCRRFVAEGASVVVADTDSDRGEALAAELGEAATFEPLDVTQPEMWSGVVEATLAHGTTIDILVNTAGISLPGAIDAFSLEAHQRMLDVNVTGTLLGMQAVAATMREQGHGSIVNMSSIDGLCGVPWLATYVATKYAVTGLTNAAAVELGAAGIRVNSVHPGVIEGPALTPDLVEHARKLVSWQPIPRLGHPDEVAALVLFLASDEASYITGSQFVIDGGHLAGPYRARPGS